MTIRNVRRTNSETLEGGTLSCGIVGNIAPVLFRLSSAEVHKVFSIYVYLGEFLSFTSSYDNRGGLGFVKPYKVATQNDYYGPV